jgi:hypothetical protein
LPRTSGLIGTLATPSQAVDGVIEINQATVFAGGVTPGDTPGESLMRGWTWRCRRVGAVAGMAHLPFAPMP